MLGEVDDATLVRDLADELAEWDRTTVGRALLSEILPPGLVITSYSIHYTKLYDNGLRCVAKYAVEHGLVTLGLLLSRAALATAQRLPDNKSGQAVVV